MPLHVPSPDVSSGSMQSLKTAAPTDWSQSSADGRPPQARPVRAARPRVNSGLIPLGLKRCGSRRIRHGARRRRCPPTRACPIPRPTRTPSPHRDAGCNGCADGCVGSLVTRCDASLRCGALVAAAPAAIGTSRQPAELTANGSAFTSARHRSSVAAPSAADLPIGNARSSEHGVFSFAAWPTP